MPKSDRKRWEARGKEQPDGSGDTCYCSAEAQTGEVELKLLLLEGFSLQNATYSALSKSSKGYLFFQGSDNIKKCFKIWLFCPSLIKICCPKQPAKLQFASALTIFILWAMDIFVVNPR